MYIWILAITLCYIAIKWLLRQLRIGNLNDKYVFITGCDSGFGNLLAKKLDSLGMNVIAGCLTEKGEADLVKMSSNNLKAVFIDVTSESSVATAADSVKKLLPNAKGEAETNLLITFASLKTCVKLFILVTHSILMTIFCPVRIKNNKTPKHKRSETSTNGEAHIILSTCILQGE